MAMAASSTLAVAIQRRQWELAALCLLVGLAEAAACLPPDSLNNLLAMLEEGTSPVAKIDSSPPWREQSRRGDMP